MWHKDHTKYCSIKCAHFQSLIHPGIDHTMILKMMSVRGLRAILFNCITVHVFGRHFPWFWVCWTAINGSHCTGWLLAWWQRWYLQIFKSDEKKGFLYITGKLICFLTRVLSNYPYCFVVMFLVNRKQILRDITKYKLFVSHVWISLMYMATHCQNNICRRSNLEPF